jgi:predicted metal-dependent peptidase
MAIFDDSYTAVMLGQPFFGSLLSKLAVEETKAIKTAAIAPGKILYNNDYFTKLSDDEGIAAVTHEVMHACYMHLVEMEGYGTSGIGPDGKPYDPQRYNEACDYVINDLIKLNKIGELSPTWLHNPNYTYAMIPADIYAMLPPSPPGGGARGPNGKGQSSQDEHQSEGAGSDPNGIDESDIMQAYESAKAMGNVPQGIDRLIQEVRRPKHSPWAMLRSACLAAMKGNDTSTWRRLNRHALGRNLVMPGRTGYACGPLAVVVDTSGSIGQEMIDLFAGHMSAILTEAKPEMIHVYWVDAEVHRHDKVKTGADLNRMLHQPVPGGGGTDMTKGINAAIRDKCEIVVVLTDGYTPFGSKPKTTKVVWGCTTEVVAPYGKTVKLT